MEAERTIAMEKKGQSMREDLGSPKESLFYDFGWALMMMRSAKKVARKNWNGKGMWLRLQYPDVNSKMSQPYIYMKTADNHLVPWVASQTDLVACDWEVIRE
jgi:Protein of unknown function (DUF2829)